MPCLAHGQGFHSAIQDVADERAKILSYHVTIKGRISGVPEVVSLTDGSVRATKRTPVGFDLELVSDSVNPRQLIARRNTTLNRLNGVSEIARWRVFLETGSWKVHYNGSDDMEGRLVAVERFAEKPKHFDPLALGLYFGEFETGDSLDSIVRNYLAWKKDFREFDCGRGQTCYRGELPFDGLLFQLTIDRGRGHWPISLAVGEPPRIQTHVRIGQVSGQWLPQTATYRSSYTTTELEFDWHSVDEPLDESLFRVSDIEAKYDFSVRSR